MSLSLEIFKNSNFGGIDLKDSMDTNFCVPHAFRDRTYIILYIYCFKKLELPDP